MAKEYAAARPASMPDMSGAPSWTIIGGPFSRRSSAEYVAAHRPPVNGRPVTIIERDVTEWQESGDPS